MKQKKHKKLKITFLVLAVLVGFFFVFGDAVYNMLAPIAFDIIVGKNPEAILKFVDTDDEKEKQTDEPTLHAPQNKPEKEDEKEDEKEVETAPKDSPKKEESSTDYSSETYIGVLTTKDLATVIKNISAADKTRIITICKSVVSVSDMPRFAKMATNGMKGDDYAFAESYLRSRLTPAQKKEIMEIVRKYLGR